MLETHGHGAHLRVRGLTVESPRRRILDDVDLHAQPGRFTALIGPNGAGKSTLLRAIIGTAPHRGSITLDDHPLASWSRLERAQRIAWVPQESQLRSPLRVLDIVAQGRFAHTTFGSNLRSHDHDAIERAFDATSLSALAERDWMTLSGGEKRRTLIARALATEATTLLLDEPTASLDIQHALRTMELLRGLAHQGYTIVSALHDLDQVLTFCDDALLLHEGRCVASGSPQSVLSDENVTAVYGVIMERAPSLRFRLGEDTP